MKTFKIMMDAGCRYDGDGALSYVSYSGYVSPLPPRINQPA